MSRRLISFLRRSKVLVLVAVLILFSGVGTIIAQNPNSVPGMLDEILGRIISLQTSVNTVQTSVDALSAPGAGENIRITPPVNVNFERNENANCQGANVSGGTLNVRIQLINSSGVILTDQTFPLAAGNSTASGQLSSSPFQTVYCKFTAVGGTKNDIRGAIAFFNPPTGGARFSLAAE